MFINSPNKLKNYSSFCHPSKIFVGPVKYSKKVSRSFLFKSFGINELFLDVSSILILLIAINRMRKFSSN